MSAGSGRERVREDGRRTPSTNGRGEDPLARAPGARDARDTQGVEGAIGGGEAIGAAGSVGGLDPQRLIGALADMADPVRLSAESFRVATEWAAIALGTSTVDLPERDKRFADPTWREHPLYRRLAQSYLVWAQAMERLADAPELHTDWRRFAQARYTSALLTGATAPTNFLPTNPAALKRAFETGGQSLVRGAVNMMRDVLTNGGMPSQVDNRSFTVGENLAATPGAVIYRDEICEILQYTPSTPTVRTRPLLQVPPQVNKYYFLDLAPGRSFVEYLVAQGISLFTIVWRNPRPEHGRWGLEDFLKAQLRALDVVREVSGSDDVNVIGACAGGLTTGLMLAYLAARGEDGVNAATFAITMIDSRYPNVLSLQADERMMEHISRDAEQAKVYKREEVSRNFAWMRPDDLVFNYVANNWLLGNDPPAFDILAWNNDGTNLVANFDREMLGIYAGNAAAKPGGVNVLDTPLDLGAVECDSFIIAGETDHITPWMPCYMTSQLLAGPSEVVVTSTGHIQTMVNPPGKPRARYYDGPEPGPDPQAWMQRATKREGSWWPRYAEWLLERSGDERPAPKTLGSRTHPAGDPAPGRYVRE